MDITKLVNYPLFNPFMIPKPCSGSLLLNGFEETVINPAVL